MVVVNDGSSRGIGDGHLTMSGWASTVTVAVGVGAGVFAGRALRPPGSLLAGEARV